METTTINRLFCRLNQFQMIYKTYFTFFHPLPRYLVHPVTRNKHNKIISLHFCTVTYFLKSGVRPSEGMRMSSRKGTPDAAWQHFCFQIS